MEALNWSHNAASAYNVADWNRLEQWTAYLAETLRGYGYAVTIEPRGAVWQEGDCINREEIDRIRRNVEALQQGFYSLPDWREIVYNNTLDFGQCNALEWDLQRLYDWLGAMVEAFRWRRAATFFMESGGVFNA